MVDNGVVKWFSDEKGYGFITTSGGTDLFVHYSNIIMDGHKKLVEGQQVEFTIEKSDRGLIATNVVVIEEWFV